MNTQIIKSKSGETATVSTEISMARVEERAAKTELLGMLYVGIEELEAAVTAQVTTPTDVDQKISELEALKAKLQSGEVNATVSTAP